jgi:hypothetical protein
VRFRILRWLPWSLAAATLALGAALADVGGGPSSGASVDDAAPAAAPAPAGPRAQADASPFRLGDRVPDLEVLPPDDLYVVDDRDEGGTVRLKFSTTIWNAGAGPMEVWGDPSEDGTDLHVHQVVQDADGRLRPIRPVGSFDFDHRHGHLHLTAFARYQLWTLGEDGPGELVAENDKVGFCLMDNLVVDEARAPADPVYGGCEAEVQGISPGWGDIYVAQLYEQDIVIEGLPDGRYRLVNVANPDGVLAEARLDNNAGHVDLVLEGGTVAPAP